MAGVRQEKGCFGLLVLVLWGKEKEGGAISVPATACRKSNRYKGHYGCSKGDLIGELM